MSDQPPNSMRRLPRWRWLRFSLRGMLLAMFVISLPLGWLGMTLAHKNAERKLARQIEDHGGSVSFCLPVDFDDSVGWSFAKRVGNTDWYLDSCSKVGRVAVRTRQDFDKTSRSFPTTEYLDAPDVSLQDNDLRGLRSVSNLRNLDVAGNPITDAGLKHLSGLSKLYDLSLKLTDVSDSGLDELARFRALRRLDVRGSYVTREGYTRFRQSRPDVTCQWAPRLSDTATAAARELRRRGWWISFLGDGTLLVSGPSPARTPSNAERDLFDRLPPGFGIQGVANYGTNSRELLEFYSQFELTWVDFDELDDEGLERLAEVADLRVLHTNCNKLSDAGWAHLTRFHSLDELEFSGIDGSGVGRVGIEQIGKIKCLRKLVIDCPFVFRDDDLAALVGLDKLEELHLCGGRFTDAAHEILSRLRALTVLYLDQCYRFDDDMLSAVLQLPKLEKLAIQNTAISDDGLLRLAAQSSLKELQINNRVLTNDGISRFTTLRPDVRVNF